VTDWTLVSARPNASLSQTGHVRWQSLGLGQPLWLDRMLGPDSGAESVRHSRDGAAWLGDWMLVVKHDQTHKGCIRSRVMYADIASVCVDRAERRRTKRRSRQVIIDQTRSV
jgi:hypothetical protein